MSQKESKQIEDVKIAPWGLVVKTTGDNWWIVNMSRKLGNTWIKLELPDEAK